MLCNITPKVSLTLNTMNEDYLRLLESARELRDWITPAEVARGLTAGGFTVSDQIMTNWKSRGISASGILDASRIIGCRPEFIRSGQMPMKDEARNTKLSDLAYRAAEIIDSLPRDQQLQTLHYLQVTNAMRQP